MESVTLKAEKRTAEGKQNRTLRKKGFIPAILYGHKIKNINLQIETKEFDQVFQKAGQTTLIDLKIEDEPAHKVLVHDFQTDPLTDKINHIDFHQIKMTEKIKTEVPVVTFGDSPAIIELEGNLILNKDSIEIECLPQDLIHDIQVDISGIKTFEDKILISDIKVPENVTILDNPEEVVVLVTPPRSEEELAELEEEVEEKPEEVEVEAEKEEGEGEEAEEGAEAVKEGKEAAGAETPQAPGAPQAPQGSEAPKSEEKKPE